MPTSLGMFRHMECHYPAARDLVIRWLRPGWLRSRGAGFSERSTATVYVDGLNRGGLESLQHVSRDDIQKIRFLHAADATTLFGTNNMGGAIIINTRF